mmetsp:Transcript_12247/g.35536  ORF Transcript_12247/g.35536 Transcript_12247/m.35536 type:complete len:242 (-) Transcript_12247:300-1025(-)
MQSVAPQPLCVERCVLAPQPSDLGVLADAGALQLLNCRRLLADGGPLVPGSLGEDRDLLLLVLRLTHGRLLPPRQLTHGLVLVSELVELVLGGRLEDCDLSTRISQLRQESKFPSSRRHHQTALDDTDGLLVDQLAVDVFDEGPNGALHAPQMAHELELDILSDFPHTRRREHLEEPEYGHEPATQADDLQDMLFASAVSGGEPKTIVKTSARDLQLQCIPFRKGNGVREWEEVGCGGLAQ